MTHPAANVIATAMLVEPLRAQRFIGLDRDNILCPLCAAIARADPSDRASRALASGDRANILKNLFLIERHGLRTRCEFNNETWNGQDPAVLGRCGL
jgi:hypothetical protein